MVLKINIRFYNARVLTLADGFNVTHGELWVCGERIAEPKNAVDVKWDREIDARGNLIMPGFKNAHTHSAMTFLRSYADDLPLLEWLNKQVFPMEAKLGGEDMYHLSKLAIMEYLTSGMTANFDMYFHPQTVSQASIDCGFRTVLCASMNDFTGSIEEMRDCYRIYNSGSGLLSYQLGFHAEYTTSQPLLEKLAALSHELKAPVFTHNSECASEVAGCVERHGTTPTVYLDSLGMFDHGGGGYHCVHVTDADIEVFRARGLSVVSNPGSNCKLASGIAPLTKLLDKGINVALGTDGPASNNCLDMFREMFLATAMQKLLTNDASALGADTALAMATLGGARAMLLPDCDTLEPGKYADLIMIDLEQPNMQPLNNITKNLVYSGSKQNVKLTMVNGKILYEDGRFDIGVEPAEVYAKANEITSRCKLS